MTRSRTVLTVAGATLAAALVAVLVPTTAHAITTMAAVRTPSALGPATPQNLVLSDGSLGVASAFNKWQETQAGVYVITFPNLGSSLGSNPALVHVTPVGRTRVTCSADFPQVSGSDLKITVRCRDLGGIGTRSRFALIFRSDNSTLSGETSGYIRTVGPQFWTSDGSTPAISHPSTGSFSVRFPTFRSLAGNRGNAHVTSTSVGRRCSITNWTTSPFNGTNVGVACVGPGGTQADADFYLSFSKEPITVGTDYTNFMRMTSPSTAGTHTPATNYQAISGATEFATVTRKSTGRYIMSLPQSLPGELSHRYSHNMSGVITPISAPANTCMFVDWDSKSATIQCVAQNGSPADTAFSLAMGSTRISSPNPGSADAAQISSKNFDLKADVGYGIACGVTVTAPIGQVQCVLGTNAPVNASSTVLPVAANVTTPTAKAIAIDNNDAGFTRILVLGIDDRVWAASGNLLSTWGSAGNFDNYVVHADPFNPIGARLFFKNILSVRNFGPGGLSASTIVGLTTENTLFELESRPGGSWQWVGASYPLPTGIMWASITHGVTGLYMLASDGRMFRSERGAASATQLPALPDGLAPAAMGGPFVRTNAGINPSCGPLFCCSGPDGNGQYPCDGDDRRFYQLVGNDVWTPVIIQVPFPPAGIPGSVLNNGNPFTSANFLVDARMFIGDVSGMMSWHYNSRLYYFNSKY